MLKSLETTVLGICTILAAVAGYVGNGLKTGSFDDPTIVIAAVTAGIGLIRAKDANKTGT